MLRRIKPFAKICLVSSMSPLIWIQPANLGGLFFAQNFPTTPFSRRPAPEKKKPVDPCVGHRLCRVDAFSFPIPKRKPPGIQNL
jgi:hypothetical protein